MAPPKQRNKQGKGKELVIESGEENPTNLVSELVEGGTSSSPILDDLSHIRRVLDPIFDQMIAAITNMSSKFELLLQSRGDGLGNREGIGTIHERGVVMGMDRDDPLQGTHVERLQVVHLVSGRPQVVHPISARMGRFGEDEGWQGMHRQEQQQQFQQQRQLQQQQFQQRRQLQQQQQSQLIGQQLNAYGPQQNPGQQQMDFLVVADEAIGRSIPFVFLDRVKEDFMNRCGASISAGDPHPLADDDGGDFDFGTLPSKKKGFKLDKLDFNFNGPGGFDLNMCFSKENKSEKNNELHYNLNDNSDE